jgi:glycosyltransferase involved in cell wall biosynthesis
LFANTEWYLYNFRLPLIRALLERGVEVVALSPPGPYGARLEREGCRWVPLPMDRRSINPLKEALLLWHVAGVYRRERPDLAHHFTIKCVVYGTIAAHVAQVRGIVNAVTGLGHVFTAPGLRNALLRGMVGRLLWACFRGSAARLIVQNPDDRDALLRAGIVSPKFVRLIRGSGANVERFAPANHGRVAGPLRILLATRLLWDKGLAEFVEASRILRREGHAVEFLVAGRPDPGNPASVPQEVIDGWHREGVIRSLGHVEAMADLLREVDIVALPSSYGEGVPKSLIEAASAGLPIIATDIPGCREIVQHEVNGLLIPKRDAPALARAILRMKESPEERKRMGAAGREKVLAEFDERLVVERTLDVYRELAAIP